MRIRKFKFKILNQGGYIALTTTLILSAIMLALAISIGSSNLLTRYGTLDFYNKQYSDFLAQSCLEYARLELAQDDTYTGDETRIINEADQCTIMTIETSGASKIIKARAVTSESTTNLKLTVDADTLVTDSFEEVVKF